MAVLLAVLLMVALLLPTELLGRAWPEPDAAAPSRASPPSADLDERTGLGVPVVEGGLLSEEHVRRRLDALAQELERLDRDPDIYAKAFHTGAARSAYEALKAEAAAFAEQPWWHLGETLTGEFLGPSVGLREILEF